MEPGFAAFTFPMCCLASALADMGIDEKLMAEGLLRQLGVALASIEEVPCKTIKAVHKICMDVTPIMAMSLRGVVDDHSVDPEQLQLILELKIPALLLKYLGLTLRAGHPIAPLPASAKEASRYASKSYTLAAELLKRILAACHGSRNSSVKGACEGILDQLQPPSELGEPEILRQCRHLCKKLKAQPEDHQELLLTGAHALQTWLSYTITRAAFRPFDTPWTFLTAPLFATLFKPIKFAGDVEKLALESMDSIFTNCTSTTLVACSSGFRSMPLLCRMAPPDALDPLYSWLAAHPQQQEEMQEALGSREYHWFLWNAVASTFDQLYSAGGGWSRACSGKLTIPAGKALGGPIAIQEPAKRMPTFVVCLIAALRDFYILLPAERVFSDLLGRGLLQERMEAYLSRSSGGIAGSGSAMDSRNSSSSSSGSSTSNETSCGMGVHSGGLFGRAGSMPGAVYQHACPTKRLPGLWWLLLSPPSSSSKGEQVTAAGEKGAAGGKEQAPYARHCGDGAAEDKKPAGGAAGAAGAEAKGQERLQQQKAADGFLEDEGPPTLAQLHLVVNILLLMWPCSKPSGWKNELTAAAAQGELESASQSATGDRGKAGFGGSTGAAGSGAGGPSSSAYTQGLDDNGIESRFAPTYWSWLLLLVALLQQATATAKRQLMQQEVGNQLLQFLYHVLLDEAGIEGQEEEGATVTLWDGPLFAVLAQMNPSEGQAASLHISQPDHIVAVRAGLVQLVVMVLHSLLFVVDPSQVVKRDRLDYGAAVHLKEGDADYLVPALALPLGYELLQQVPEVPSSPLLFLLLEVVLRKATDPNTRLQAMHLLETIMQPHRCTHIAAAGPAWPATLTLVGALISSRKAARSSNWKNMASCSMAAKLLHLQVQHGIAICNSWKELLSGVGQGGSSGSSSGSGSSDGNSSSSSSGGGGGDNKQQDMGHCHGREEGTALEHKHLLCSLRWALLSCMLGATDILSEFVFLAVQATCQSQRWQEVGPALAAATAGGARGSNVEVCKKYQEAVGGLAGPGGGLLPFHIPMMEQLKWTQAVSAIGQLLYSFGLQRVVNWAQGLRAQGVWEKLGPEHEAAFNWITTLVSSIGDSQVPGGTVNPIMEDLALDLAKALGDIGPVLLPGLDCPPEHRAKKLLTALAVQRGVTKLERKLAATGNGGIAGLWNGVLHMVAESAALDLSCSYGRGCCNNPRCKNLSGMSEMGLVVRREGAMGVCRGCKVACYCSARCQKEAWVVHRVFCAEYVKVSEGKLP